MIRGGRRITAVATGILCAVLLGSPRPLRADASSAIQTAQRQMNSGNYTAAIATLQAAIPGNPSSGELFYWLGRAYYEVRDWDSAVAQGEKSVSLDAKNSLYHDWLGREYGGKADRDRSFSDAKKVKSEFKQAVALDSSNIVARRDLEEYCLDAPWIAGGSKDEALEQVNGIAAVDPVAGHLAKALYDHEGTKNNEEAESELKLALAGHPKSADPYFEAADLYRQLNKAADMAAALDEAAHVSANDPRLSYYRGVAGVLSNANLPDAERDLKSYLASTPDRSDWPSHAGAREWLGRLYELQGKRADAAEQYREALQLDPKRKEAKSRLEKLEKN
ncbi:MAG: tetratricopeptide repeat protein [Candidatus Acidiferrales bacterium]